MTHVLGDGMLMNCGADGQSVQIDYLYNVHLVSHEQPRAAKAAYSEGEEHRRRVVVAGGGG